MATYSGSLRDYVHLIAWGQIGVLLRYYLRQVLGGACKHSPAGTPWVPCVTSPGLTRPGGALFLDLPANIVGCFIMGFLSPADLLLLSREPAAAAPPASTQKNSSNQLNSSPLYQSQQSRTSEVEPMSLTGPLGHGLLNPRYGTQTSVSTTQTTLTAPVIASQPEPPPIIAPGVPWPALPRDSPVQQHASLLLGLRTGLCGCTTTFASWMLQVVHMLVGSSPALPRGTTEWPDALCAIVIGCLAAQASLSAGQQLARLSAAFWHTRLPPPKPEPDPAPTSGQVSDPEGQTTTPAPPEQPPTPLIIWCIDAFVLVAALTLTGVSIALITVTSLAQSDSSYAEQHSGAVQTSVLVWVSILMSPVGCLFRWKLAALNTCSYTTGWPWYPHGTWLANTLGCLLDYTTDATMAKLDLTDVRADAVAAIVTGVGGSLSTVSTWVVELQKLGLMTPKSGAAVWYLLLTLGPALAAGVLVYGTVALVNA